MELECLIIYDGEVFKIYRERNELEWIINERIKYIFDRIETTDNFNRLISLSKCHVNKLRYNVEYN